MRISLLILAVFAVLGSPAAEAQRRRKPVKPAPKASPEPPKPGTCETVPGAVRIRRCYPVGGVGQFTARVTAGGTVWLHFDEPIVTFLPPSKRYFSHQRISATEVSLRPLVRVWPDYVVGIVKTRTMSITIAFAPVAKASLADAQIHIMRLDRRQKDAEVERRVAQHKAMLDAKHKARIAALDKRARRLARTKVLDWIYKGGVRIREARGKRHKRHDHLRIMTKKRVKVGNEYFLYFRVLNRNWSSRTLALPTAKLLRDGSVRPLPSAVMRCGKLFLPANKETTCVVGFGIGRSLEEDERLVLTVREARGDASVTLRGIDVR